MSFSTKSSAAFRLAAIDLDDTLLGPDRQVSAANAIAVRELRERGIRIVLASGRRHENMIGFHRQLSLDGLIVSSQGALVRNAETDAILHQHLMPAPLATEIVLEAAACDATLLYYHLDAIYTGKRNRLTDIYQSRGKDEIVEIGDITKLVGESPLKIIWMDDPNPTANRFRAMSQRYSGVLEMVITSPEYLEFMACGITKATGLAAVADHYAIAPESALAFGDANNDVTMLQWAGLGVAMNVSSPSVRAVAKMIAPPGAPAESLARAVTELIRMGKI